MERLGGRLMTRLVGINHVALEVGNLDEALAWYGRLFAFQLRGRVGSRAAFVDMGDQFLALMAGSGERTIDTTRHFGLVVDDKEAVCRRLGELGVSVPASGSVEFVDPWGNHVQVVDYREIQFTKAPAVLRGMGLEDLTKTGSALDELRRKGLADSS